MLIHKQQALLLILDIALVQIVFSQSLNLFLVQSERSLVKVLLGIVAMPNLFETGEDVLWSYFNHGSQHIVSQRSATTISDVSSQSFHLFIQR